MEVASSTPGVDADMFIAPADMVYRGPTPVRYTWSVTEPRGGRVRLNAASAEVIEPPQRDSLLHDIPQWAAGLGGARKYSIRIVPSIVTEANGSDSTTASVATSKRLEFDITARVLPRDNAGIVPGRTTTAAGTGSICATCSAVVPTTSLSLHAAVCARQNVRCAAPGCGAVLRRGASADAHRHCDECGCVVSPGVPQRKHSQVRHAVRKCEDCTFSGPLANLRTHALYECHGRLVTCRFCGATAPAGPPPADHGDRIRGLSEHESYCGSRTVPCGTCRVPTRLKSYETHCAVAHPGMPVLPPALEVSLPPRSRSRAVSQSAPWVCALCTFENSGDAGTCGACGAPPVATNSDSRGRTTPTSGTGASGASTQIPNRPLPCRNAPCGGISSRAGDAAALGLCSRCFAHFAAEPPDADALHAALQQRYLAQLVNGCGSAACTNAHCSSSTSRVASGAASAFHSPAAEVEAMLEEAFSPLSTSSARYYVCVAAPASAAAPAHSVMQSQKPLPGATLQKTRPAFSASADHRPFAELPRGSAAVRPAARVAGAFF